MTFLDFVGDLLLRLSPVAIASLAAYLISHRYQKKKDEREIRKELMEVASNGFVALYNYFYILNKKSEFDKELSDLKLELNKENMKMDVVLLSYLPKPEMRGKLHKLFLEFDKHVYEISTTEPGNNDLHKEEFDEYANKLSKLREEIIYSIRDLKF